MSKQTEKIVRLVTLTGEFKQDVVGEGKPHLSFYNSEYDDWLRVTPDSSLAEVMSQLVGYYYTRGFHQGKAKAQSDMRVSLGLES